MKIREKNKYCTKRFVERTPKIDFQNFARKRLFGAPYQIWKKVWKNEHDTIRSFCIEAGISYYSPTESERNFVLREVFGKV